MLWSGTPRSAQMFWAVLATFVLLAASSSEASAQRTSEELLRSCEVYLQGAKPVGPNMTWVPNEAQLCNFYLEALRDTAWQVNPDECSTLPCRNPYLRVCPPPGISVPQFIRIFVNFAQRNPRLLHEPAAGMAITAFQQAFPCR